MDFDSRGYLRVGDLPNPVLVGVTLDDDLIHILNDLHTQYMSAGMYICYAVMHPVLMQL